jgi:3'(2'), 5'-bisphosphate nucleotidase
LNIDTNRLLELAIEASIQASSEILKVYQSGDFQAEAKGDNSPLTIADKNAHRSIVSILQTSNIPILSEEGKSNPLQYKKELGIFLDGGST